MKNDIMSKKRGFVKFWFLVLAIGCPGNIHETVDEFFFLLFLRVLCVRASAFFRVVATVASEVCWA